jgi:hypothetical protein
VKGPAAGDHYIAFFDGDLPAVVIGCPGSLHDDEKFRFPGVGMLTDGRAGGQGNFGQKIRVFLDLPFPLNKMGKAGNPFPAPRPLSLLDGKLISMKYHDTLLNKDLPQI